MQDIACHQCPFHFILEPRRGLMAIHARAISAVAGLLTTLSCLMQGCRSGSGQGRSAVVWVADTCSSCNAEQISVDYSVFLFLANPEADGASITFRQVTTLVSIAGGKHGEGGFSVTSRALAEFDLVSPRLWHAKPEFLRKIGYIFIPDGIAGWIMIL
jgi:hypothetical protein